MRADDYTEAGSRLPVCRTIKAHLLAPQFHSTPEPNDIPPEKDNPVPPENPPPDPPPVKEPLPPEPPMKAM